jgi:hypothetical protein
VLAGIQPLGRADVGSLEAVLSMCSGRAEPVAKTGWLASTDARSHVKKDWRAARGAEPRLTPGG